MAPVVVDRVRQPTSCVVEPVLVTPLQVRSDDAGAGAPYVHVCRLPTHGIQQSCFLTLARQLVQLYARAVRREPPHEPGAIHPDARIGTPDAAPQDRVIADPPRQGGECLRFLRDAPTAPRGERDEPLAP